MEELKELKKAEEYADQCMKCGFCAFFCPVYQVEKTETSLARGKNYLAKLAMKGEQKFTPEMGEIIGKCLLCKRCVANCPSKTEIDRVVIAARAQMVQEKGLGFLKNFVFRKVMANKKGLGHGTRGSCSGSSGSSRRPKARSATFPTSSRAWARGTSPRWRRPSSATR